MTSDANKKLFMFTLNRAFLQKVILKIGWKSERLYTQLSWKIRCFWLNAQPGFYIDPSIHLSRSAQVQAFSDGLLLGGNVTIASGSTISDGTIIDPYGGRIVISEGCFVGPYCVLYGHGGLTVGRNTMIAGQTLIIPSNHGFTDANTPIKHQPPTNRGIHIGEDVWIGAGCKILDGVCIENGCVVGAGSVVSRSLPANTVAVGSPAKVIKMRGTNE